MSWNKKICPQTYTTKVAFCAFFVICFPHWPLQSWNLDFSFKPRGMPGSNTKEFFSSSNSNFNIYVCKKENQIGPKKCQNTVQNHSDITEIQTNKSSKRVQLTGMVCGYTTSKGLGWGFQCVCFTESWVYQAPWERPAKGDRCLSPLLLHSIDHKQFPNMFLNGAKQQELDLVHRESTNIP